MAFKVGILEVDLVDFYGVMERENHWDLGAVIRQGLCYVLIKILWLCSWGNNNNNSGTRAGVRKNNARDHAPLSSCSVPHESDMYGIY